MARHALISGRQLLCRARRGNRPRLVPGVLSPVLSPCTRAFATAADNPSAANGPSLDSRVRLVEVGPRDGLQNEKKTIPLETKLKLISRLAAAGLSNIEAGAFVSPKWVPQMGNSSQILEQLIQSPPPSPHPLTFSFLTPNIQGLESATSILAAHPGAFATQSTPASTKDTNNNKPTIELAIFASATESFSRANLNCSVAESLARFRPVVQAAKADSSLSLRVRAYISVVLGCPFEGHDVDPHRVASVATELLEMGADEIALGDTTGMGTAPRTKELLTCLRSAGVRNEDIAVHFHDTYGQALVNIAVALEHGIRVFDCAVGGLGGCPYSPGATGNVATEDVVYFLESLGMDTGVDLGELAEVGEWINGEIGRGGGSVVGRAVMGRRRRDAEEAGKE